jgi:endonuclease/exonuclease/phosphatase family metal-dependent hydrolase
LTWNVWWRFGPAWQDRQPALLRCLRQANADVVALQECWGTAAASQAHEFAQQLGMYAAFVEPALPPPPSPPEHADQDGVAVGIGLICRWPLLTTQAVPMPTRHRRPAPVAMLAIAAHPIGPLHIVVACLEWEPTHPDDRIAQAQAVLDLATDPSTDGRLPVILCGDLNAAPNSPILKPVREVLIDGWTAGGGDPDAVTLPSTHPQAPTEVDELIDQRIDHIFLRPGRPDQRIHVESPALVGATSNQINPSDHHGVRCDIVWTTTQRLPTPAATSPSTAANHNP